MLGYLEDMKPTKLALWSSSAMLLVGAMGLTTTAAAQSDPSGTWLDETTNWNEVGAELPQAPDYPDGNNLPNCDSGFRQATLPEDALVESAGWTLFGAAKVFNGTTAITAMANADGMCRPLDFQVFVFSDGEFVGTLSPILMDSRTDGSAYNVELYGEDRISAVFNRYTPEDPLCCASGISQLFYELDTDSDSPVLVPQLPADTTSTSADE
jgi:hypothetical protein